MLSREERIEARTRELAERRLKRLARLSDNEQALLLGMHENCSDGYAYTFKAIALHSSIDPKLVRRTVRALARKGYTGYVRGLMDDAGQVCGSGYEITTEGRKKAVEILGQKFSDEGNLRFFS